MLNLGTRGRLRRLALVIMGAAMLSLAPGVAFAQVCGNGALESPPEGCDDGNTVGGDGCSAFCTIEDCGNAILDVGETCDPATGTCGGPSGAGSIACSGSPTCDNDCTPAACGDGNVNAAVPEDCESGGVDTAGCDGDPAGTPAAQNCTFAGCGDTRLNTANNEQCDDGNATPGDGCGPSCKFEVCGNGIVDPGEACDDGNGVNDDGCDTNCTATACGNGIVAGTEECDDGANDPGDGCGPTCLIELCGNAFLDPGEECDPCNPLPTASCVGLCQDIQCGNG